MCRHELNCLTKEEFERSARSPALERQSSQMHSPLSSSMSFNETIRGPSEMNGGGPLFNQQSVSAASNGHGDEAGQNYDRGNKALALMMQPSIDYGKFAFSLNRHSSVKLSL